VALSPSCPPSPEAPSPWQQHEHEEQSDDHGSMRSLNAVHRSPLGEGGSPADHLKNTDSHPSRAPSTSPTVPLTDQSRRLSKASGLQLFPNGKCVPSITVYSQDFEVDSSEVEWENATAIYQLNFTRFLAALGGKDNLTISKTFSIVDAPDGTSAGSVTVEFVVYTIDSWEATNYLDLVIGDSTIQLSHLGSSRSSTRQYYESSIEGISWWQSVLFLGENLGFGVDNDAKHLVELTIQRNHFENGSLFLLFQVHHKNKFFGIDDVTIEANFRCSNGEDALAADLATGSLTLVSDYGLDQRVVLPFCSSEEFPCGTMYGMVSICHHSSRHGFRSLCIHEENSDILKHYIHDYCGPCIGEGRQAREGRV
jgi:hypothetical protein